MVQEAKVAVANIYKQSRESNPVMCFLVVAKVSLQFCVRIDYSLCVHVGCHHISEYRGLMSGLYDVAFVLTLKYCFFYTLRYFWVCNSREKHATLFVTTVPCNSFC